MRSSTLATAAEAVRAGFMASMERDGTGFKAEVVSTGDAPRDVGLGDLMIVLRAGSTRVALHAEHARGVATVTVSAIQPANAVLASADHFAGVVMIEDKIVLLPDVASFLAAARNVELREATAA